MAIIRHRFNKYRDPAWPIALIAQVFQVVRRELARTLGNGPLDRIIG